MSLKNLVDKQLTDFIVREMTEVFRIDLDGRYSESVGCFKDPTIATAFAGQQQDAPWHKTKVVFVLTNGLVGYEIDESKAVRIFSDEVAAQKVREGALKKLSAEERAVLRL